MKNSQAEAFTLIELLVMLALIAVLVGAIVVGINPVRRIRDSKNAKAKIDVAIVAKVVESCLVYTNIASGRQNVLSDCNTSSKLMSGSFSKAVPSNGSPPNFQLNANANVVCISQEGEDAAVNWKYYTADQDGYTAGTLFQSLSPCLAGR